MQWFFNPVIVVVTFCLRGHTSDFKTGTLVAALPGAWQYRVSAGMAGLVSLYFDRVR